MVARPARRGPGRGGTSDGLSDGSHDRGRLSAPASLRLRAGRRQLSVSDALLAGCSDGGRVPGLPGLLCGVADRRFRWDGGVRDVFAATGRRIGGESRPACDEILGIPEGIAPGLNRQGLPPRDACRVRKLPLEAPAHGTVPCVGQSGRNSTHALHLRGTPGCAVARGPGPYRTGASCGIVWFTTVESRRAPCRCTRDVGVRAESDGCSLPSLAAARNERIAGSRTRKSGFVWPWLGRLREMNRGPHQTKLPADADGTWPEFPPVDDMKR